MKYKFYPSHPSGEISAPPSKSMAHRLIICSALSKGKSTIKNIALSDDIKATLSSLGSLGVRYEINESELTVDSPENLSCASPLFCGESASTLRFLLPLCLVKENSAVFYGSERLFMRPLGEYEKICNKQGVFFSAEKDSLRVSGRLKSGVFNVSGSLSSQFISGLLFALPLLDGDSVINVTPPFFSRSYVEMTIYALSLFGIEIERKGELTFTVKGNQRYSPQNTVCEGDFSNSALFHALGYFGGDVTVSGLSEKSLQGDRVYGELFSRLNNGTPEINVSDCIDLAPLLFAFAGMKNGARFTGTGRLALKESDRAACMKKELLKVGIRMEVRENAVTVFSSALHAPEKEIESHSDHRVLMAMSLPLTVTGGVINGTECINKSFPDFFEKLGKLNIKGDILV